MENSQQRQLRLLAPASAPLPRLLDQLAGYEAYLIGEQRRPQGRAKYLWTMRQFIGWLGEEATQATLTAVTVQRYKEHLGQRGCASATVINALAAIRDFSLWSVFEGYRSDDPTLGIRRPPKRRPNPNPLYPDELELLMRAIDHEPPPQGSRQRWYWQRNRLAVLIFLSTGLRLSELAEVRWGDLSLSAGVLNVRAEAAKNGQERQVPLPPPLLAELAQVPASQRKRSAPVLACANGRRLQARGLEHVFDRWLPERLAALAAATGGDTALHLYAHRMRHTFASLLVWDDVDLRTVQELLGHRQLETTAHYTKTDVRRKQAAVAKLPDFAALGRAR